MKEIHYAALLSALSDAMQTLLNYAYCGKTSCSVLLCVLYPVRDHNFLVHRQVVGKTNSTMELYMRLLNLAWCKPQFVGVRPDMHCEQRHAYDA